jgi:uncharacterized spore protein YtfJ
MNEIVTKSVGDQEKAFALMEKLFAVAEPGSVFSEPVAAGDYTVITASDISVGMGFGYGAGGGSGSPATQSEGSAAPAESTGYGGGGGGGGASRGRPVAAISVGPNGVEVEPIVDVTKLGLAFFTTIGSMFLMFRRMRRAAGD